MTVGERIKAQRKVHNMSLEELAQQVGLSRQTLSRYETGIIINIPSDKIEQLAKILSTTPAMLMGWNDTFEKDAAFDVQRNNTDNTGVAPDDIVDGTLIQINNSGNSDVTDLLERLGTLSPDELEAIWVLLLKNSDLIKRLNALPPKKLNMISALLPTIEQL